MAKMLGKTGHQSFRPGCACCQEWDTPRMKRKREKLTWKREIFKGQ